MNIHVETGFDGEMYFKQVTSVHPPPPFPECLHPDTELSDLVSHVDPCIRGAQEHSCPYCKSIYIGFRCHSCGAPRRESKPTYRDHFPNVHTICTTT